MYAEVDHMKPERAGRPQPVGKIGQLEKGAYPMEIFPGKSGPRLDRRIENDCIIIVKLKCSPKRVDIGDRNRGKTDEGVSRAVL